PGACPSGRRGGGPAVSKKRKLPWIIAALHGGSTNQIAHVCVGNTIDAASRFGNGNIHGPCDFFPQCFESGLSGQLHPAAQETVFVQVSEDQISVRDRDLGAA